MIYTGYCEMKRKYAGNDPAKRQPLPASKPVDAVRPDCRHGALDSCQNRCEGAKQPAAGSVSIRIENNARMFSGRGANTDIIVASAHAYLSAMNRMLAADEEQVLPEVGTTPD